MEERVEFGSALRRLREEAGLSQSAFSARIHYSKGYLSKVETGKASGNREFAKACDVALLADGALSALIRGRLDRQVVGDVVTAITGLPPTTPHFTGRGPELRQLAEFVAREDGGTACVLSGMAGAGKTALALRASWDARESFPDGCLFLDLRGHALGAAMATAHDAFDPLLRLLGVPGEQIPPHVDARANLYRSRLHGKRVLLVFDNVRSAAQVAPLLPAETRCRVLITSRNRLNALDDAAHLPVDVLPLSEAVALFRAVGGDRARSAEDAVVGSVVERCGRLPLAIRIAAARFRGGPMWTVEDFEERLADETSRLDVLDDGERSVAAAFSLSCRALTEDELRLFALLALHPGHHVDIRSTAALAGVGLSSARSLVDHLGDAHLVAHDSADHLTVHDLVREFARDRVLPSIAVEEQVAAVRRMLDHNLFLARSCDEFLAPHRYRMPSTPSGVPEVSKKFTDRESALRWIDQEWPTLVGLCHLASSRGLHRDCWELAFILRDFFFLAKLWDAWIDTHLVAAASARAVGDALALAMTLDNLGMAHVDRGDLAVAVGYYEEALELFRELGDEHGTTDAVSNLAWAALYLGDHGRALRDLGEVMEAYRKQGKVRNAAIALRGIALVEVELGRYDDAVTHAQQARLEFVDLGLDFDVVMSVNCVAWAHFQAGDHDTAVARYTEAAELGERCGSRYETARALTGLGNVHQTAGRGTEAAQVWASADEVHGGLNPVMIGEARVRFGERDS